MTEHGPSTVSARLTSCPGCGQIEGVEQTSTTPRVAAWKCTRCAMAWAITRGDPSPQPFFDHLAATVEQLGATRSVLRAVITLADDAATLPDKELRDRLRALADRAKLAQRPLTLTSQDPGDVTVPR